MGQKLGQNVEPFVLSLSDSMAEMDGIPLDDNCGQLSLRELTGKGRYRAWDIVHLFSPGIFWSGLLVKRSGWSAHALQMSS